MKKASIIGLLLLASMVSQAGVITYTPDNSIFANPERGFTDEISDEITDSNNHLLVGNESYFDKSGERQNQSLVVMLYNLTNYKTCSLSQQMLQGFDEDMQVLRNKGFKCVLRFAYSEEDEHDADLEHVLEHIGQLTPHLQDNADVIYVLEAGFVGEWGEWYYSEHFGYKTQQLTQDRRQILKALLDACPVNRFLLVRYPIIKTQYLGDEQALTPSDAFSGSTRARIGHHNDAFLNKYGNDGTYGRDGDGPEDDPVLRQYIATETLYVPNGGETNVEKSNLANIVAEYDTTMDELTRYHWSFCGAEYSKKVTDKWRANGAFTEMEKRLGYRFQLVSATLPERVTQGETLSLSIQLENVGFAPLYNERPVYLVLHNALHAYPIQLQADPRRWLPDSTIILQEELSLPQDIVPDTYSLYIYLPDASSLIAANPKFAVRLANQGLWDAETGMNRLNASLTVESSAQAIESPVMDEEQSKCDLLGRPVDASYHGIVIQNGKKRIQ